MRTSTETAKLFAALAKAQGAILDPPMTGKGQAGRSVTRYAMLGDIVPVIRAASADIVDLRSVYRRLAEAM